MARRRRSRRTVTQQIKAVNDRYKETTLKISEKQERVVTAVSILVQGAAQFYTPQDTNALINSQYRRIMKHGNVYKGRIGYTQNYALALHENPDWKPRPPNTKGKKGGGYNPNATSKFLIKGYLDEKENIKNTIISLNRI